MVALDARIRPLYEHGMGCRHIGAALKENPVLIFKRLRRMGIVRTRKEAIVTSVDTDKEDMPFTRPIESERLRASAMGDAIRWFLDRGYKPSMPIDVAHYDLIVESDAGLKRIQVKTTTAKDPGSKRWVVGIMRHAYDKHATARNSAGKRRHIPYSPNDVDYFYILTGDRSRYIVPVVATRGTIRITLDVKFAKYRVA
jgi:hypothetical protein